jgi:pimeloyl-ACP methyl ester carboxylesterase
MAEVKVDGKRVYYHTGGTEWRPGQPTVVFLHGAGFSHVTWHWQARSLAHKGYSVAAPDLPGHGGSEDLPGIASVEDYAGWCARFLDALGIPAAHFVGHSMGGAIAVTLASRNPERVRSLTLIGTGLELKANAAFLKDCLENHPRAVDFITSYGFGLPAHLGSSASPGAWLLTAGHHTLAGSGPAVMHRDFAACNRWDGAATAPKVRCPALVLSGALDRLTPAKTGRALADAIPGARYEALPAIGHMLPNEAPRAIIKKLVEFLAARQ